MRKESMKGLLGTCIILLGLRGGPWKSGRTRALGPPRGEREVARLAAVPGGHRCGHVPRREPKRAAGWTRKLNVEATPAENPGAWSARRRGGAWERRRQLPKPGRGRAGEGLAPVGKEAPRRRLLRPTQRRSQSPGALQARAGPRPARTRKPRAGAAQEGRSGAGKGLLLHPGPAPTWPPRRAVLPRPRASRKFAPTGRSGAGLGTSVRRAAASSRSEGEWVRAAAVVAADPGAWDQPSPTSCAVLRGAALPSRAVRPLQPPLAVTLASGQARGAGWAPGSRGAAADRPTQWPWRSRVSVRRAPFPSTR
ncbi:uncharacterized protein LOC144330881 [Macaca mulatta]